MVTGICRPPSSSSTCMGRAARQIVQRAASEHSCSRKGGFQSSAVQASTGSETESRSRSACSLRHGMAGNAAQSALQMKSSASKARPFSHLLV